MANDANDPEYGKVREFVWRGTALRKHRTWGEEALALLYKRSMVTYIIFILSTVLACSLIAVWTIESHRHTKRLTQIPLRIHVNGIRGKSTVTRIVAGILRESGITTVAKCTGSAAAIIHPDGQEDLLHRRGAPTILEQLNVIQKMVPSSTQAIVMECMALRPNNQAISEERIIRSNIGILTNVREDHQDVMGETLPEIARALLNTCPRNGLLITGETNPEILRIIREEAKQRGSELMIADSSQVCDEDLAGFDYIAFKDNVAIGLALASALRIPLDVAMKGMQRAQADSGSLQLKHVRIGDKRVTWANLLAVNDRESTVLGVERLAPFRTPDTITVGLLNNRSDREQRAFQFADIASRDLKFDRLVTLGAYENLVMEKLVENAFPKKNIISLGDQTNPDFEELIQRIILDMPSSHVLVVGLGNIHTTQADLLRTYLEQDVAEEQMALQTASKRGALNIGERDHAPSHL